MANEANLTGSFLLTFPEALDPSFLLICCRLQKKQGEGRGGVFLKRSQGQKTKRELVQRILVPLPPPLFTLFLRNGVWLGAKERERGGGGFSRSRKRKVHTKWGEGGRNHFWSMGMDGKKREFPRSLPNTGNVKLREKKGFF